MSAVSPVLIATLQSAFISICSCVFANLFTQHTPPIIPFLIFSLISTPPNYLWQQYLERRFPGYLVQKLDDEDDKAKGVEKRLNIRNTLTKFLLDQTLGAVVNTVAFLGAVRLLKGDSLEGALIAIKEVGRPFLVDMYLASSASHKKLTIDDGLLANLGAHDCGIQAMAGI